MPVDLQRVAAAALRAAIEDAEGQRDKKRRGLTAGKALALGAVVVTAGRVAAGPSGRFLREKLEERFGDSDGYEDDEYDEPEDDDEDWDEPEDEDSEDWDDEEPEPPEGEGDHELEDEEPEEPEDEEPEPPEDEEYDEPEAEEEDADEDEPEEEDELEEEEVEQPAAEEELEDDEEAGERAEPPIFDAPPRRKSKNVRPGKQPPRHPPRRRKSGASANGKE